jgi:hypothetical protein
MKWFKMIRGLILGLILVIGPFAMGGPFDNTRSTIATLAFVLVGLALIVLVVWAGVKSMQRERLSLQPVAEADDAGMGFLRRERQEREREERERANRTDA